MKHKKIFLRRGKKSSSENKRELIAKTNELGRLKKRNTELNALFKRLYEDSVLGKVVIHERSDKWSKSAEQQNDIYFRYIGNLTMQPV